MPARRFPKGTPKRCNGGRPFPAEVRFCACVRCALLRAVALNRAGLDSPHPGATITRAFTENA